jgi:hypothetical protein
VAFQIPTLAALLLLAAIPRAIAAPSPADIEACTADALRLCKAEIERQDYQAAGGCVLAHRAQLSKGCRAVIARVQAKAKVKDKGKKRPKIVVRVPVIVPVPLPKPPIEPPPAPVAEPPGPAAEPPAPVPGWLPAIPLLVLIAGLFIGAVLYLLRRLRRKQ